MINEQDLYIEILRKELIPAMGCTEPIALAFAASKCREVLGEIPHRVEVFACGSIIKNVKSVVVPNTGGLKGIEASIAAGIIAGDSNKNLEVINHVDKAQIPLIRDYLATTEITTVHLKNETDFHLVVVGHREKSTAKIEITGYHTNIVLIEKDGQTIFNGESLKSKDDSLGYSSLSFDSIWNFSTTCDITKVEDILNQQIDYNFSIAEKGLSKDYGANIGKVMLDAYGDGVGNRIAAMAASAVDARMSGCEMPVIINSGSGNQGITCSVPIIEYAKIMNAEKEQLLRALLLSNLLTIYQKQGIGTLSAFCGAVCAGASAGAGISYLKSKSKTDAEHTFVNALAIVSGMVCDGAKPSCAAKVAFSIQAGFIGIDMYSRGQQFRDSEGIITKGSDNTVKNIGRLGREGMRETNDVIIDIMI